MGVSTNCGAVLAPPRNSRIPYNLVPFKPYPTDEGVSGAWVSE